jgi:hypothetical protein
MGDHMLVEAILAERLFPRDRHLVASDEAQQKAIAPAVAAVARDRLCRDVRIDIDFRGPAVT